MNTDKVKVGLLGLIALTLIINTYFVATKGNSKSYVKPEAPAEVNSMSNIPNGANTAQPVNPNINTLPSVAPAAPTTTIKFAEDFIDFGNVVAQSENRHSFEFVNNGTEPLTIENARGTCGCTVPNWPKEPIMPGATGKIDVVFTPKPTNVAKEDKKQVIVTANTNPKETTLTVKAFVSPKE